MRCSLFISSIFLLIVNSSISVADEPTTKAWKYTPEALRPFWEGDTVEGESVLFIRDEATGEARASVLFPVTKILSVKNSAGDTRYEEGRDFLWKPNSREIVLPAGSRIVSKLPQDLRRPAGTQRFALTHRDGNGEILFGAKLEYADMQTCISYQHEPGLWKSAVPKFDPKQLPRSIGKLTAGKPVSIVLLGDSISTGLNCSQLGDAPPFQPGYHDLLKLHLAANYESKIDLLNLSVGGKDSNWGKTQVDAIVDAKPDLVLIAFGMNDSAGRSAKEYQANTKAIMDMIREKSPETEFILVASMLGNRDWIRLQHDLFPQYRDALAELCEPGIALADLTSIWAGILELKQDWDQTGNGVNHPNDWGHRIYAQVIASLLMAPATAESPR